MKLYIVLMLFVSINYSYGQDKSIISGIVQDFHDKTPLQNAKVTIGTATTTTNEKGKFTIKNIQNGTYTLIASHADCEIFTESLTINGDQTIIINLEHHAHDIETVTLHGNHKKSGSLIIKTLDQSEIDKNSTENLGNLLTKISGVSVLKTGNSIAKPIIHGLYGSRIAILNNGVKLAEQEWGVEHAPNVDVSNFEHIDVIKGAAALKYGSDAIGGVIVMEPEVFPKKDTLKGKINLSGISNGRGLGLDVDIAKIWKSGFAIKAGGSIQKLGDQHTPDYTLKNTGKDFNSFNFTLEKNTFRSGFSLDYYLTNQNLGILRDSHVSSKSDYAAAMQTPIPFYSGNFSYDIDNPRQLIEHHLVKLSAFNRFENIGKLSATYSFQYNHRQEFDLRRGYLNLIPSLDLALITNQFNLNDLLERDHFTFEIGLDAKYQNNFSDPITQSRRLIPNYDLYGLGGYSVFKYKISPHFNAEAGIRYDYNQYLVTKWYDKSDWENQYAATFPQFYVKTNANRVLTNPDLIFQNISYNLGAEYHPTSNVNLKLNYAKVGRTPNIAELFADGLHHSAAIIERGNMMIKNEEGHQFNFIADAKFDVLKGLEISANPYFFITKNFINQIPSGVLQPTQFGTFPVWIYQQINAKMYGLDLDVDWGISDKISYKAKASYVYGQDETHDLPLIMMMPPNFSNAIYFKLNNWHQFYFSIENQTFLHQNRYPNTDVVYNDYVNGQIVTNTLDFSTPPKTYTLWHLQTGINITKNTSFGLVIHNLLDTRYRDYLNRMRYFADDQGINVILNFNYKF